MKLYEILRLLSTYYEFTIVLVIITTFTIFTPTLILEIAHIKNVLVYEPEFKPVSD
jgi:hypothetical protein